MCYSPFVDKVIIFKKNDKCLVQCNLKYKLCEKVAKHTRRLHRYHSWQSETCTAVNINTTHSSISVLGRDAWHIDNNVSEEPAAKIFREKYRLQLQDDDKSFIRKNDKFLLRYTASYSRRLIL